MLDVTFYGVRGSTPCCGPSVQHYGGATSCVLVRVPGEQPIICDLGTGLRQLGNDLADTADGPFLATALLSHLHWDHVQGVAFFPPVLRPQSGLDVYGPRQEGTTLEEIVRKFVAPPLFPVSLDQLPGEFSFHEVTDSSFSLGSATVSVFDVAHVGPTNGYRIDCDGGSVAYISDCQEPPDGELAENVLAACDGVDVLIHDAQYSRAELESKSDWGHCTPEYAYAVAEAAGAKRLVLFHHDPSHDDAWIEATVDRLRSREGRKFEVLAARQGLVLRSGAS